MIDGSEKRKRHLALNFRIRSFLKRAVIGNQVVFSFSLALTKGA